MIRRLDLENCAGIIIDVQEFFLKALKREERQRIEKGTADFASLMTYLQVPTVCTVERPLEVKGGLPDTIERELSRGSATLEKDHFDLTGEREILRHLKSFNRKQMILVGCETDVCVLQSCLGLLAKRYEVFVVEDLLFSSSEATSAALERMRASGATLLTFKTLFYELLRAVRGSKYQKALEKRFGQLPERLSSK